MVVFLCDCTTDLPGNLLSSLSGQLIMEFWAVLVGFQGMEGAEEREAQSIEL